MFIDVPCLNCHKIFKKDTGQIKFYPRNFCSRKCAYESPERMRHLMKRITLECIICKKAIEKPRYKKNLTKYCSNPCRFKGLSLKLLKNPNLIKKMNQANRELLENRRMQNNYQGSMSSQTYRKIADINKVRECNKCHKEKRLLIHHKNRNRRDNRPKNLEPLCYSCHKKEHIGDKHGQTRTNRESSKVVA